MPKRSEYPKILQFESEGVKRLVEHTLANPPWVYGYVKEAAPAPPGLFLVHDDGVYLMSNSEKVLPNPEKPRSSFVVHAVGCDPQIDPGWWENSRHLVGGDDFGELLPIKWFACALARGAETIKFEWHEDHIGVALSSFAPVILTFDVTALAHLPPDALLHLQFGGKGVFLQASPSAPLAWPSEFPEGSPETSRLAAMFFSEGKHGPFPLALILERATADGLVQIRFAPDGDHSRLL